VVAEFPSVTRLDFIDMLWSRTWHREDYHGEVRASFVAHANSRFGIAVEI